MTSEKSIKMDLVPPFNILLFLLFFALKINNIIDWNWWWVTSPLWIPLALGIFVIAILALLGLFLLLIGRLFR
jgi:hypothetical protein